MLSFSITLVLFEVFLSRFGEFYRVLGRFNVALWALFPLLEVFIAFRMVLSRSCRGFLTSRFERFFVDFEKVEKSGVRTDGVETAV